MRVRVECLFIITSKCVLACEHCMFYQFVYFTCIV